MPGPFPGMDPFLENRWGDVHIQKLIDDAWRDGGYSNLKHTRGPMPPFDDDDAEWVREWLREYLKSK